MFEDEPAMKISETDSVREEMGGQTWSYAKVEEKKKPKTILTTKLVEERTGAEDKQRHLNTGEHSDTAWTLFQTNDLKVGSFPCSVVL